MKKNPVILFLLLVFASVLISCKKEFEKLQVQIDDVVSTEINPIKKQIEEINGSIKDLEQTDKELKGYIETLEGTARQLQADITANDTKIDQTATAIRHELTVAQTSLEGNIALAKTEVVGQLTALRTEMQGKLDAVNATISELKAKDTALETQIANLRTYVDTQLALQTANTKEWANSTFSTLAQYQATTTEIEAIKSSITTLNASLTDLETRLNTKIAADIATAVSTLEGELATTVTEITTAYTNAISTAKSEITSAYTTAIANAISASEISMKTWVNEQLTGYYTIAKAETKLDSLHAVLNGQLTSQQEYLTVMIGSLEEQLTARIGEDEKKLDTLKTTKTQLESALAATNEVVAANTKSIDSLRVNLAKAKAELTEAYTSAINTAITTLDGKLTGDIATAVTNINTRIDQEVAALDAKITTLTSRVAACEAAITAIQTAIQTMQGDIDNLKAQMGELIKQIQSIAVIPEYSDGSVGCSSGNTTFHFKVLPTGTAARLAEAPLSAFKMEAVYTKTKVIPTFIDMPISKVEAEGDVLIVTSSTSELTVTDEQSVNAILEINFGLSSISTGYFPLFFAANSLVVNASLSASTPFSASFTCNVSKTEGITEYGICYSEGNSLCNNTTTSHNMDGTGVFTVDLTSLTPQTSYYYRAYAIIGGVAMYSGLKTFATEEISTEMIHTTEINDVTAFSAHCSGSIDSRLLDYPSIIIGICYSNITNTPTLSDYYYTVSLISQTGVFSSTLTGLMPNSPYHCRVYAKLGEETIYGNVLSFNTNTSEDVVFSLSCDSISYSTITLKGKVNVPNDSYESIAMGFYYNTTNSFDQYTNHVFVSSLCSDDTFIADISVFENTQYYYKAFAVIDGTTFYGNVLSVTSSEIQVSTNAILDLGLSVKWAGSNVGAASPELMGNTYAWGELTANKTVNYLGWDNYKYCMGTPSSITKYNTDASCGVVDNKTRLEFSDDAAYQSSGGTMRIPTKTEMEELIKNCTWIWGTYKGVKGFKIWNKADPNHNAVMFLPTKTESSPDEEENHEEATSDAAYWTSDLRYSSAAYRLYISNTIWSREFGSYDRAYPVNIRAVVNTE